MPTRVALENDYDVVLEGLRALLRRYARDIRVVEIDIKRAPRRHADLTLLDTYGEDELIDKRVRGLVADPAAGAIVVFSFSDQQRLIRRSIKAGAAGFISKALTGPQIVDGIRATGRGERVVLKRRSQRAAIDTHLRWPGRNIGLTERESELWALLPTGMTNQQLAKQLYVSDNTIKTQLRSLYTKLDVHNRTQAAAIATQEIGTR